MSLFGRPGLSAAGRHLVLFGCVVQKKVVIIREQFGGSKSGYKLLKFGGSAWESNPPRTVLTPYTGFEVREPHQ